MCVRACVVRACVRACVCACVRVVSFSATTTNDALMMHRRSLYQPHSRHKIGKPPPLDLIAAHEKALRGASASAVKTDFGADVDVATLCCEGIPWNPFIAEDVELLAQARAFACTCVRYHTPLCSIARSSSCTHQGRKPFRASLDDFQRVQNMLVE